MGRIENNLFLELSIYINSLNNNRSVLKHYWNDSFVSQYQLCRTYCQHQIINAEQNLPLVNVGTF